MNSAVQQPETTPFERIGGTPAVRRLVDRFYRIMDESPEARPLRAIHAADLEPMRVRLTEYLTAWLGGPRTYFERSDAKCIMSAHSPFAIDAALRDQWMSCMRTALEDTAVDPELRSKMDAALGRVAEALRNR